jgi:hypothetical protein
MRLYKYAGISLMPQAVHPSVVKSAVNISVRQRRVWLQRDLQNGTMEGTPQLIKKKMNPKRQRRPL